MAKRTLGLGKSNKQRKKQKSEESSDVSSTNKESDSKTIVPHGKSNELTVELEDEVDPDDELAQLKGLWNTYINSDKETELVLNGIIHECDRLLRNQTDDNRLPAEFHSIYALSLSELALFHTEDEDDDEKEIEKKKNSVKQYFEAALERIELGQEQYPESIELNFSKSRILINRIPLEFISQYDLETKKSEESPEISKILDEALKSYEKGEESVNLLKNYSLLDSNVFETLKSLDDLLEIIRSFGKTDISEGLDSDDEEDEFDEEHEVKLSKNHPLYKVHKTDKYFKWLIEHGENFGDNVLKEHNELLSKDIEKLDTKERKNLNFLKEVCLKVGQLLLQAAEKPSNIFTTITYDSDVEDDSIIDGFNAKSAQKEAIKYSKKAVEFFLKAEDEEDPQSWVNYAEAVISLGNLYDYESKDQEECYKIAEKKLRRANNATNGKFQKILDNLLEA